MCTISMANVKDRVSHIKPPRVLFVKFPRGSMLGEPRNNTRQRKILFNALDALATMTEPGTVKELPYRWKRPDPA